MLVKWKLFGRFQQSEALPTGDCRPSIGLPWARTTVWLERDGAGPGHNNLAYPTTEATSSSSPSSWVLI